MSPNFKLSLVILAVLFAIALSSCAPSRLAREGQTIFAGCAIAGGVDDKATLAKGEFVCRNGKPFDPAPFAGNGRSCGSCHMPGDNFGLSQKRVKTLSFDHPLFFPLDEDPELLLNHALIRVVTPEGLNEFRPTPKLVHLARNCTRDGRCDSLGLLGDRTKNMDLFTAQAVANHLSLTVQRRPGIDFRLPTARELRAIRAYQRSVLVSGQDERNK